MKSSKFDWGVYLRPSKTGVERFGFDPASFAIGLGKDRDGLLVVVRDGHRSIEKYAPIFWLFLRV